HHRDRSNDTEATFVSSSELVTRAWPVDAHEGRHASAADQGPALTIINRGGGQVVEIVLAGPVDAQGWLVLESRLLRLVQCRQPGGGRPRRRVVPLGTGSKRGEPRPHALPGGSRRARGFDPPHGPGPQSSAGADPKRGTDRRHRSWFADRGGRRPPVACRPDR